LFQNLFQSQAFKKSLLLLNQLPTKRCSVVLIPAPTATVMVMVTTTLSLEVMTAMMATRIPIQGMVVPATKAEAVPPLLRLLLNPHQELIPAPTATVMVMVLIILLSAVTIVTTAMRHSTQGMDVSQNHRAPPLLKVKPQFPPRLRHQELIPAPTATVMVMDT
jgi:hypothetical protein